MFTGQDPLENKYRGRAHLAEMIALLGPPPPSLLARAKLRDKFFSNQGELYRKRNSDPHSLSVCHLSHPLTFLFRKVNFPQEFLYLTPDPLRNEKRPFEQQRTIMKKTGHLSSASCGRCYNGNPSSAAPRGTWQRTSGFFDILHESKFMCENLHARCHSCMSLLFERAV